MVTKLFAAMIDDTYTKPVQIYRGEKPIKKLMQEMVKEVQYCQKTIATKFKKPLKMSDEDEQHFQAVSYLQLDIYQ